MRTLIILGNGFDIAHGLETSYGSVLDAYMDSIFEFKKISPKKGYWIKKGRLVGDLYYPKREKYNNNKTILGCRVVNGERYLETPPNFFSIFFKKVLENYDNNRHWGDLEETAYKCLFNFYPKKVTPISTQKLRVLYEEFDLLKKILISHLKEVEKSVTEKVIDNCNISEILATIVKNDEDIKILNFNYTSKLQLFLLEKINRRRKKSIDKTSIINIHGKLDSPESVIFGYGNEDSEEYYSLLDNKLYDHLKYFKHAYYFEREEYESLMNFLSPFNTQTLNKEVKLVIIGHSCGRADETLLKQIFNNNHINSIDLLYHTDEAYRKLHYSIAGIIRDSKRKNKILKRKDPLLRIRRFKTNTIKKTTVKKL